MLIIIMDIDYNKLKYFLTVVECGGVTAAAKKLHRTQSAVSQAILSLEKQLGLKLIAWQGKRLQLSREGKIVYSAACARIAAIDEQLVSLATFGQEIAGCIEIGMLNDYSTNSHELLFAQIADFRRTYPAVIFQVHIQTSDKIEQALLDQELDMGVLINFHALHRFHLFQITTEQHLIVSTPDYLKRHGVLKNVQDVLQADLIDIDPYFTCFSPWVSFHASELREQLEKKRPVITVPNFFLIRELVLEAQGIAVLPHYLIKEDLLSGAIVQVLPEFLALRVWVNGAILLGRTLRPAEHLFLQKLQNSNFKLVRFQE